MKTTTQASTAHLTAPGFWLCLQAEDSVLTHIEFLTDAPTTAIQPLSNTLLGEAARQIQAWFENPAFIFDLPLRPQGTDFRQRVWAQIAAIPLGHTRTYGDIAKTLNSAPRAVGQACGDNPLPIIVPCHRVVSASGLGGFNHSAGESLAKIKRWLLAHEAQALRQEPFPK
jgi:methylated-DNA-[protein]-cysteine S-methyltransferase